VVTRSGNGAALSASAAANRSGSGVPARLVASIAPARRGRLGAGFTMPGC
jgi:hypothetical protein